jgi:lipooligosaccharide transport system ATP-binding protein
MINAKNLSKKFGDHTAVNNIDLDICSGECFGLLGPNGAGKSTIINMTYGAVQRSSGELSVFGLDPNTQSREIKKRLGVVTQENALDENLTVIENMLIYSSFIGLSKQKGHDRVDELLEFMNLSHKKDAPIQSLSGGMKRRLVFVRALLGKPELLILDEPTTGLDPAVRHLIWGKIEELRKSGTTIILTTHYMHEAEVLCDRLVVMNHGKIAAQGSPEKMINELVPGFVGIFKAEDLNAIKKIAAKDRGDRSFTFTDDSSGVYVRTSELIQLTAFHSDHGLKPLQIRPANLEDVFLKLTGQELTVDA